MAHPVTEVMEHLRHTGINGSYTATVLAHLGYSLARMTEIAGNQALWVCGDAPQPTWLDHVLETIALPVQRVEWLGGEDSAPSWCLVGIGAQSGFVLVATPESNASMDRYAVAWSCSPQALAGVADSLRGVIADTALEVLPHLRMPEAAALLQLSSELLTLSTHHHQSLSQANQALVERLRSHEDQTHMIIHDMRTPLHTLQISLKTLRRFASEVQQELLEVACESSTYLLHMTETLLDVTRIETSHWQINLQPASMHDLIDSICAPFERATRPDQAHIEHHVDPDLPLIWIDHMLIQRMVSNLISNALRYTPAGGTVRISVKRQNGGEIAISVEDTGQGIPPEALPHIFERFYQAKQREAERGNGLGLYFCHLAAEAHGGRISVESELNVGSRFVIHLPLRIEPE